MMSAIKEKILSDMKEAMRNQQKERLSTIRLILAALKQREVDERIVLSDNDVLGILNKMVKQRRDSILQFEAGQRLDLVTKEQDEIAIIQSYLPAQLSPADIDLHIDEAIQETKAASAKDMGKVMGILKNKLQGKADMTLVSTRVKEKLA